MPRVSPTPLVLAKRTLLGSAIATIAYCGVFLPFPAPLREHGFAAMLWSERIELLTIMLPLLLGIGLSYGSLTLLSRGINRLRFTESQLEQARAFVQQPRLTGAFLVVFLTVTGLAIFDVMSNAHHNAIIMLFTANPLNYVRSTLRRPISTTTGPHIDWSKAEPLHSDHWGDPPALQLEGH